MPEIISLTGVVSTGAIQLSSQSGAEQVLLTGVVAAKGETGETGATGATGAMGPQGLTGATGATGATGPQGIAGVDGRTVHNGTGAPSGALGVDDDFYLNTANYNIYGPKTGGAWGSPTTLVGPTGAAGANGATWSQGSGAPTGGANGDFYFRTSNNDIYQKIAGVWTVIANTTGATGPTGPTGATGPTGPAGSGTGDMLASVYDAANGAEQVAFESTTVQKGGVNLGTNDLEVDIRSGENAIVSDQQLAFVAGTGVYAFKSPDSLVDYVSITSAGVSGNNTSTVHNILDPTNPQEAATKNYVDTEVTALEAASAAAYVAKTGDVMAGTLDMGTTNPITNLLDPVNPQDAATKNYVDTENADNVVGPASSIDNAIARFDSTTGKLVQNSLVTIADNGDVTFGAIGYLYDYTTGSGFDVISPDGTKYVNLFAENSTVGMYANTSLSISSNASVVIDSGAAGGINLTPGSAGATVSSVPIVTTTATQTLTNKRIEPRYASYGAATATMTPSLTDEDFGYVNLLSVNLTINAPAGTPQQGQKYLFRFKDNGTARTLTWNAIYRAIGVTLPTTTVISKYVYVGCVYNSTDTKWDVIAVAQEA